MPNSRFCLGELEPAGAAVVGAGALVAGSVAPLVGAGALVAGSGAPVATAAVGSAGVGAAVGSGPPPQLARIGSAITSSIAAALIRNRAKRIFTMSLLVERNIGICSIALLYTISRVCCNAPTLRQS